MPHLKCSCMDNLIRGISHKPNDLAELQIKTDQITKLLCTSRAQIFGRLNDPQAAILSCKHFYDKILGKCNISSLTN